MTISAIGSLHFGIGPTAISGLIIAIIVNSIDRCHVRRPTSHVSKECNEIISPFLRHANAPATIIFEFFIMRIVTSGLSPGPSSIFNGTLCARRTFSMRCKSQSSRLTFPTATTDCSLFSERVCRCSNRHATIALANPRNVFSVHPAIARQNDKAPEALSNKINYPHTVHHILTESRK